MGFFSRVFGMGAFSMAAGAAANGVQSTYASQYKISRHDDTQCFNTEYHKYRLGEVFNVAEDVAVFRFLLRRPETEFFLPACSTLQCFQRNGFGSNSENIQRSYTPITRNGEKGYFDLLVKKQPKGRMTETLFSLKPGDYLDFRCRMYKFNYVPNKHPHIGMIAGGTGITPMLQVIRESIENRDDKTKLTLAYGNQSEGKILLRGLLEELAEKSNGRFENHFIIDKVDDENRNTWKGYVGWMDEAFLKKVLPDPKDPASMVLLCGPDGMMVNLAGCGIHTLSAMSSGVAMQGEANILNNGNLGGILAKMGYNGDQCYRF